MAEKPGLAMTMTAFPCFHQYIRMLPASFTAWRLLLPGGDRAKTPLLD
jgi:hypothetical protein